jgi:peroxiredoxin
MEGLFRGVLFVLLVVLPGCGNGVPPEPEPTPEETVLVAVGDTAPGFELTTLTGETFNLEEHRGKVVLVNFFATWCPPCREELPFLEKDVWKRFHRDSLSVIVVGREENDEIIRPFVDKHGYTVPFAADPEMAAYSRYATRFIPRNFVIGPDGTVLYQSQGYTPREFGEMVKVIEDAVAALDSPTDGHSPPAPACSSAEHRQFDFWIGEWTVTTPDGEVAGHNTIESIMGGCALRESWTGAKGNHGTSLNIYSPRDGTWRQTWIDEQGTLLEIRGGIKNGSMVMEGGMTGRDGKPVQHRIVWTPNDDGSVSQRWSVSTDGAETWKIIFSGSYTRAR